MQNKKNTFAADAAAAAVDVPSPLVEVEGLEVESVILPPPFARRSSDTSNLLFAISASRSVKLFSTRLGDIMLDEGVR